MYNELYNNKLYFSKIGTSNNCPFNISYSVLDRPKLLIYDTTKANSAFKHPSINNSTLFGYLYPYAKITLGLLLAMVNPSFRLCLYLAN